MQYGVPRHGDLVVHLHHWTSGLALINETRQHEHCHFILSVRGYTAPVEPALSLNKIILQMTFKNSFSTFEREYLI